MRVPRLDRAAGGRQPRPALILGADHNHTDAYAILESRGVLAVDHYPKTSGLRAFASRPLVSPIPRILCSFISRRRPSDSP